MNVNTNKRKADVKAEDDVQVEDFEIGNMNYRYIDNNTKMWLKIFSCMDWRKRFGPHRYR